MDKSMNKQAERETERDREKEIERESESMNIYRWGNFYIHFTFLLIFFKQVNCSLWTIIFAEQFNTKSIVITHNDDNERFEYVAHTTDHRTSIRWVNDLKKTFFDLDEDKESMGISFCRNRPNWFLIIQSYRNNGNDEQNYIWYLFFGLERC